MIKNMQEIQGLPLKLYKVLAGGLIRNLLDGTAGNGVLYRNRRYYIFRFPGGVAFCVESGGQFSPYICDPSRWGGRRFVEVKESGVPAEGAIVIVDEQAHFLAKNKGVGINDVFYLFDGDTLRRYTREEVLIIGMSEFDQVVENPPEEKASMIFGGVRIELSIHDKGE